MASGERRWHLITVLALVIAAFGMSKTFDGPFARGWLGHNGARYSQIARNHARLGWLHLRGAPLLDAGVADPERPDVYAHHPPALALSVAASFSLFGESETAARLVPALATLLTTLLLVRLGRAACGTPVAALAALAFVGQPMVSVYGAHVDVQGPPVLALSLLVLLAYRRWRLGGGLAPFLVASAAASAFDWYGLYAPVACGLHLLLTRPAQRGAALGLMAWAAALFGLWMLWLVNLPGMSMDRLGEAAGVRGLGPLLSDPAGAKAAASAWFDEVGDLMPGWPLLLLVVGAGLLSRWGSRSGTPLRADEPIGPRGLLALLAGPPIVHALLFPAGTLQHGYWLFGLPPALALGVAWAASITLRPAAALGVVGLLVVAGIPAAGRVLAERDELPSLVGTSLAGTTAPDEPILTNFACNPYAEGSVGDRYVLKLPAVTFYADRVVRGEIASPADLADALARRPDAVWFLATPWPDPPSAGLAGELAARSVGEPILLNEDPPVRLFRLAR